jgi:hypothetical protein
MLIGQYTNLAKTKREVNVRRFNKIVFRRKLRLASFVPAVRLIKGFHNNPAIK